MYSLKRFLASLTCNSNFFSNFTKEDILVQIDSENGTKFVVNDPDSSSNDSLSASNIRCAIGGNIRSRLLINETYTVESEMGETKEDDTDWPLILGVSIAAVFIIATLFVLIYT